MEYPKIQSVFKRDNEGKFILGEYSHEAFHYLYDAYWEATEKIDGTNIRVIWDGEKVVIGGKTDKAQIQTKLLQILIEMFPEEHFDGMPPMTLFGEGFGPGIQKGGKYLKEPSFCLFDVFIDGYWLRREDVTDIRHKLALPHQVVSYGTLPLSTWIRNMENGIEERSVYGDFPPEGLVLRPCVTLYDHQHERIITKLKYKDFA